MTDYKQWNGFKGSKWREEIDVRSFIQDNYTPYEGDESFLEGPTEATNKLWGRLQELQKEQRAKGGVLDCETEIVTSLTAYGPGYIDESLKDLEKVVGLQTDKPLKRAFMPYGGIKMAQQAAEAEMDSETLAMLDAFGVNPLKTLTDKINSKDLTVIRKYSKQLIALANGEDTPEVAVSTPKAGKNQNNC